MSGYYDIAHGDGLAALLPAWMRYTFSANSQRFYSLGKKVFGETDGIQATEKFLESIGMRLRLGSLGVELGRLGEMADCAVKTAPWPKEHSRVLDAAAVKDIYKNSY